MLVLVLVPQPTLQTSQKRWGQNRLLVGLGPCPRRPERKTGPTLSLTAVPGLPVQLQPQPRKRDLQARMQGAPAQRPESDCGPKRS